MEADGTTFFILGGWLWAKHPDGTKECVIRMNWWDWVFLPGNNSHAK